MIDPKDINLPDFLANWYGPPVSVNQPQVGDARLPDPLREWYGLAHRWKKIQSASHHVYDPQQIRVTGGKCEFMADSTGDWFWAFDPGGSNSVYEAELRGEWKLIPESFSVFLVHLTIVQVAASASFGRLCSQVPDELLLKILEPMEEVGFGGWNWPRPGHRIFMSEELIADVGPAMDFRAPWRNRSGFSSVSVSGMSSGNLDYLDCIPSVKWLRGDVG
ncbi:hypothetical protein [Streptomyces yanii]|uniref:SMI1/KNR4 family protein n=1 Tax=Streptomyces yanii TaxID=78510 RepID=A0ABV5R5K5_9ACTN